MFNSKSIALKAMLPVAGAALAAGVIGAAAPAQAMPIVLDGFSQAISGGTLINAVGSAATTSGPSVFTGTGLAGANRTFSVLASGSAGDEATLRINASSNRLVQANDGGVSSNNLVTYTFNATDFTNNGKIKFRYSADGGDSGSTYKFHVTLSSASNTYTVSTAALTAALPSPAEVAFSFYDNDIVPQANLTGITSASIRIEAGSGRDISITSPITANAVPVPPAVLATGIGAAIAAVKTRKQQAEAVAV
jgi:hypothetical protein